MKWTINHQVVATILYSQLFDSILSYEELKLWLICSNSVSENKIQAELADYKILDDHVFAVKKNYQKLLFRKQLCIEESQKKWQQVPRIIRYLGLIPTIELVGISGGLAMNNVEPDDDIDLFFVVHPKTLWITRFLILCLLELFGVRRTYGVKSEKNLFCANMFMTRGNLELNIASQNLYTAHEVLQMIPILSRNNCYKEFLYQNSWVKKYLANAWNELNNKPRSNFFVHFQNKTYSKISILFIKLLQIINPCFRYFQLWYMRPHRTREVVSDQLLMFHPVNLQADLAIRYKNLLIKHNVPLDSSFLNSLQ